jgi:RHS repeat-associated protein
MLVVNVVPDVQYLSPILASLATTHQAQTAIDLPILDLVDQDSSVVTAPQYRATLATSTVIPALTPMPDTDGPEIVEELPEGEAVEISMEGGQVIGLDGEVNLEIPIGVVEETAHIYIERPEDDAVEYWLSGHPIEILAYEEIPSDSALLTDVMPSPTATLTETPTPILITSETPTETPTETSTPELPASATPEFTPTPELPTSSETDASLGLTGGGDVSVDVPVETTLVDNQNIFVEVTITPETPIDEVIIELPEETPTPEPTWEIDSVLTEEPSEAGVFYENVHELDETVRIQVAYNPDEITGEERSLTLFYWDEQLLSWVALRSEVDIENHILTGYTDHFSIFDYGTQNWQTNMPTSLDAADVSSYTGAATYEIPIEVFPGPGGLQPSLTLRYNSMIVDDASYRTQASWVGMGWSLDVGYIQRNMHGTQWNQRDDTFIFNLGGVTHELVPVDATTSMVEYRTVDETFWVFRRYLSYAAYSPTLGNTCDFSYWAAYSPDGMTYYFEDRAEYPYLGDDVTGSQIAVWRWSLTRIRNQADQELTFTYFHVNQYKIITGLGLYTTDVAVYPQTIVYPNNRYRILFDFSTTSANRSDTDSAWNATSNYTFFLDRRLNGIRMQQDANGDGIFETLAWRYQFNYDDGTIYPGIRWPNGGETPTLITVQRFAGSGESQPAITFEHTDLMHITAIENGYGGRVEYVYETDPWHADYRSIPSPTLIIQSQMVDPITNIARFASINPLNLKFGGYHYVGNLISLRPGYGSFGFSYDIAPYVFYLQGIPISSCCLHRETYYGYFIHRTDMGGIAVYMQGPDESGTDGYFVLPVVTRYRVTARLIYNGINSTPQQFQYSYEGAAANTTANSTDATLADNARYHSDPNMEFRGHSTVTVTDPYGTRTVTHYYQDDILQGRPEWVKVYDSNNVLLTQTDYVYGYTDPLTIIPGTSTWRPVNVDNNYSAYSDIHHRWVYTSSVTTTQMPDSASPVVTSTTYTYDSTYGNVLTTTIGTGSGSSFQPYRQSVTTYNPTNTINTGTPHYLVSLPAGQETYQCPGGTCSGGNENLLRAAYYLYDGATSESNAPTAGLVTGQRSLLYFSGANYTDPCYSDQTFTYDSWGNRITSTAYTGEGTTGALASTGARTLEVLYDQVYHTYPVQMENAIGQVTLQSYDYTLGIPVSQTTPGGAVSTAGYDVFGRMISLRLPGDESGLPTVSITYHDTAPYWVSIQMRTANSTPTEIRRIYDGLGNLIQTQSAGALVNGAARDVITDYIFDVYHRQIQQTVPYDIEACGSSCTAPFRGQSLSQAYTATEYDALGRVVSNINTDSTATTYEYTTTSITITDTLDRDTVQTLDEWGQVTEVETAITNTVTDLTYEYDHLGQLTSATTGAGTTTISYDMAGRKTSMDDPDMGSWSYVYDALGNLTSQTDANGCTIGLSYDALNHLTGRTYSAGCPTTTAVSYTYDNAANGTGLRIGMQDASGSTTWEYDARNRLIEQTRDVTNMGVYTLAWEYDSANQVTSVFYPGDEQGGLGEELTYTYTPQETLATLAGLAEYVSSASYDSAGRLTMLGLNDEALATNYTYSSWTTGQGRLATIQSGNSLDPNAYLDLTFAYSPVGNITSISDAVMGDLNNPQVQTFSYDEINRLTSAAAEGGLNDNGDYSESYTYDPNTGNLTSLGGISYTYGDSDHVHAVTAADANSYSYDDNGNMTSHAGDTLIYDAENRIVRVERGGNTLTEYVYNGDGEMVLRIEDGNTTVYIGNYVEIEYPRLPGEATPTATLTVTSTLTETGVPTDTVTMTETPTASATVTETPTLTLPSNYLTGTSLALTTCPGMFYNNGICQTYTRTYTPSATRTFTRTNTRTYTPTKTNTPQNTSYFTLTPTRSRTPAPTQRTATAYAAGLTATRQAGLTGTRCANNGCTSTPTQTPSPTRTVTETPTVTNTPTVTYTRTSTTAPQTTDAVWTFYYYAGSNRVAERVNTNGTTALYFLFTDHLGSTSVVVDSSGAVVSRQLYRAFGAPSYSSGTDLTDYGYTGQRADDSIGLMYYNARWYDPTLGRFTQADTIIPGADNPIAWDRYAYTLNNPTKYSDPSGHCIQGSDDFNECMGIATQIEEDFPYINVITCTTGDWSSGCIGITAQEMGLIYDTLSEYVLTDYISDVTTTIMKTDNPYYDGYTDPGNHVVFTETAWDKPPSKGFFEIDFGSLASYFQAVIAHELTHSAQQAHPEIIDLFQNQVAQYSSFEKILFGIRYGYLYPWSGLDIEIPEEQRIIVEEYMAIYIADTMYGVSIYDYIAGRASEHRERER